MKAVICDVPAHILEWRKRTGADRFDEMWDGVLHMAPTPNIDHQELEGGLETWLRRKWAPRHDARVVHQINVAHSGVGAAWVNDYRIPDLVLVTPARMHVLADTHLAGGPDVVVEIRIPSDEACEKLDFYAEIGCREVWVIDRDTKAIEIHDCDRGRVIGSRTAGADWLASIVGVEFRRTESGLFDVRLTGDDTTLASFA